MAMIVMQLHLQLVMMVMMLMTAVRPGQTQSPAISDGLFASNGTHILFVGDPSVDGNVKVTFTQHEQARIVGLAVDAHSNQLFWSDIQISSVGIYRGQLQSDHTVTDTQQIVRNVGEVNGLAVDWVSKNLYWTDASKGTVEVVRYDGSNRRTLLNSIMRPRGIFCDPIHGYLYWGDQGSRVIERSRPDGSSRRVIAGFPTSTGHIKLPNQLTVYENALYWVDSLDKVLMTSGLEGSSPRRVAPLSEATNGKNIYGLAVMGGVAYVSVWDSTEVLAVTLQGGSVHPALRNLGYDKMFSLAFYDRQFVQKQGVNVCDPRTRNGCSDLCLATGPETGRCACPSVGGLVLDRGSSKSCSKPEKVLLYAASEAGEVAYVDIDDPSPTKDTYVVGRSSRPVAVAYDPVQQVVYWSDVFEKAIYRAKFDGTDKEIFLSSNQSIGVVDGMTLDVVHRKLYYTNMGFVLMDSTSYSWHKIEAIDLDTLKVRTVVHTAEKPRGLWVDPVAGYLYYSDWGSQAGVMRTDLDGSNPTSLMPGLDNPNAVLVSAGKLYVLDSHYKTRKPVNHRIYPNAARNGSLYVANAADGHDWQSIAGPHFETPYGLSLNPVSGTLYVTDWATDSISAVTVTGGNTGSTQPVVTGVRNPMAVLYTVRQMTLPGTKSASSCASMRFIGPGLQGDTCVCSSYNAKVLGTNQITCSVPRNFLLFSDMGSIKMVGMDSDDQSVYTLVNGTSYLSNFAALAFDPVDQALYYSDVNRRRIIYSKLDGSATRILYIGNHIIDGMVYSGGKVFWTDYLNGVIASVDETGQKQTLVTGLSKPRAISIYRGNLYWTEWGSSPGVARISLDSPGGTVERLVRRSDLLQPNGLYIDPSDEKMYIADAHDRKILKCNLNGDSCEELRYVTQQPRHLYDIIKFDHVIYYTDWVAGTVSRVNMDTGDITNVADGLMRPTQMALHFSATPGCPSNHNCSDRCVPVPGGYDCDCRVGRELLSDRKTCQDSPNGWRKAQEAQCSRPCPKPASQCAHKVGTKQYECQCKPGYQRKNGSCVECAANSFKTQTGDSGCQTCPSGTAGASAGKVQCSCTAGQFWDWHLSKCAALKVGACPAQLVAGRLDCTRPCQRDGDCAGAQKCCSVSHHCSGSKQCLDPVGLPECVYDGKVYQIGDVFQPNACTSCHCQSRLSRDGNRVGGTTCQITDCLPLACMPDLQYVSPVECCPRCKLNNATTRGGSPPLHIVNCPRGLVELEVSPSRAYARHSFMPLVNDVLNLNRELERTKRPAGSYYWWTGRDVDVTLTVTAHNLQGGNDTDTCSYKVQVKDVYPPEITCPSNVSIFDTEDMVTWSKPVVHDNVGVMPGYPKYTGDVTWGSRPQLGRHTVTYKVMDKAGNLNQCSFTITVTKSRLPHCKPPSPLHGNLQCTEDDQLKRTECEIQCPRGFSEGEYLERNRVFHCEADGLWKPALGNAFSHYACVQLRNKTVKSNMQIDYPDCPLHLALDNAEVKLTNSIYDNYILGSAFGNTIDLDVDIMAGCQPTAGRSRRSPGAEDKITTVITLQANYHTEKEYKEYVAEFDHIMKAIRDAIKAASLKVIDQDSVPCSSCLETVLADDIKISIQLDLSKGCVDGEVEVHSLQSACMVCPDGTYADQTTNDCQLCPKGHYQEEQGQRSCKSCPDSENSPEGSYTKEQCGGIKALPPKHSASKPKSDKTLIGIAIGCAVGVLVLTVIVISIVVCRRHRRGNIRKNEVDRINLNTNFSNPAYVDTQEGDAGEGATKVNSTTNIYEAISQFTSSNGAIAAAGAEAAKPVQQHTSTAEQNCYGNVDNNQNADGEVNRSTKQDRPVPPPPEENAYYKPKREKTGDKSAADQTKSDKLYLALESPDVDHPDEFRSSTPVDESKEASPATDKFNF